MITLTKEFKWPMGHRLPNHKGGCRHMHGHNYKMEVTISGELNHTEGNEEEGMIIDFSRAGKMIKAYIDENLDHTFMVYEKDTVTKQFLQENGHKNFVVPFIPTAEGMALYLFNAFTFMFDDMFKGEVMVEKVKIWETDSSSVEFIK